MTTQTEAQRLADAWENAMTVRAHVGAGNAMAAELRRLEAEVQALRGAGPAGIDDYELSELAHSANQEALSFGLSHDVFLRYFKTICKKALAAAPQPERHETLRCAVGNCTFNGEVATHAPGCPSAPQPAAQPTEPAGEPVAWMNPYGGVLQRCTTGLERETHTIKLYTRPAVPLSDEFLLSLWSGSDSPRPVLGKTKVLAFARAIEAAHKIGGAE